MDRDAKIEELFSVFLQFRRHMHRQMLVRAQSNISVAQAEILFAIGKGMNRLRDIAKAQNITPSAATQQLKLLETAGLAESMESPDDRRENLLSLTIKGQELLQQHRAAMKERMREYINRLSDEEIEQFTVIMKKMINAEKET
jgi:DNA-binding MarR family transcriptional regulator